MNADGVIRLQFSRQYDVNSALIAWFTQGKFSHVDALWPDGRLTGARSDIVGSVCAGVQTRPAGYAHWKYTSVLTLAVTAAQQQAFYDFITLQIGKPYDMSAILMIAIDGPDIEPPNRDWRQRDSWICSELVTVALEISQVFREALVSASKIAPDPLFFACSVVGFTQDA